MWTYIAGYWVRFLAVAVIMWPVFPPFWEWQYYMAWQMVYGVAWPFLLLAAAF
jgi:hypothetical protein